MDYSAFISYSHAADGKLAPQLQAGLHRLGKPWYKLRALRVFRDKTSLSASPELWSAIVSALDSSEHFILMASPEAAQSQWVQREVQWWKENRSPGDLLLAITDGEICWDDAKNDFDWGRTTCLPVCLAETFSAEPLFVDLRWVREDEHLSPRHPQFGDAVAEIAAPLHGCGKDELIGADIREQRRTRRIVTGTAFVLIALIAAFAWQRHRAGVSASIAGSQRAANFYEKAFQQSRPGNDNRLALHRALQAARAAPREDPRKSLHVDRVLHLAAQQPSRILHLDGVEGRLQHGVISVDLKVAVAVSSDYKVAAWELESGEQLPVPGAHRVVAGVASDHVEHVPQMGMDSLRISATGRWAMVLRGDYSRPELTVWDIQTGQAALCKVLDESAGWPFFSRDGHFVIGRKEFCERDGQQSPNAHCCCTVLWAESGDISGCRELDESFDHEKEPPSQVVLYQGGRPRQVILESNAGGQAKDARGKRPEHWLAARMASQGERLVTLSDEGTAFFWSRDVDPLAWSHRLCDQPILAAGFDGPAEQCALVTKDGELQLRDVLRPSRPIVVSRLVEKGVLVEQGLVEFSPDGERLLVWFTTDPMTPATCQNGVQLRAAGDLQLLQHRSLRDEGHSQLTSPIALKMNWDTLTLTLASRWDESEYVYIGRGPVSDGSLAVTRKITSFCFGGLTADGLWTIETNFAGELEFHETSLDGSRMGPFPFRDAQGPSTGSMQLLQHASGLFEEEGQVRGRLSEDVEIVIAFDPWGTRVEIADFALAGGASESPEAITGSGLRWAGWMPQSTSGGPFGNGGELLIIDAATGYPLAEHFVHPHSGITFAFSADGTWLHSISRDGVLRRMYSGEATQDLPAWANNLGKALTGLELQESGTVRTLSRKEHASMRRALEDQLQKAADGGDEIAEGFRRYLNATKG